MATTSQARARLRGAVNKYTFLSLREKNNDKALSHPRHERGNKRLPNIYRILTSFFSFLGPQEGDAREPEAASEV